MGTTLPQALAGQAAHALLALCATCLLGVLAGRFAARAMREQDVHWSWCAIALVLVLLSFSGLGRLAPMLMVAAFTATRRGRRLHNRDIDAGGELRERATRRRSPAALLGGLARRALARATRTRLARDGPGCSRATRPVELGRAGVSLGNDEDGSEVQAELGPGRAPLHTLIVGATGSGKTVTQGVLAAGAIRRGMAAVVIDPKGDGGLRASVSAAALDCGRPFLEWTPAGGLIYNPYGRGSETEIADRVLAGERFTEPHYLRQAQRYLGHAVRALRAAGREITLSEIALHMEPERLEQLLRDLPECDASIATQAYLGALTPRQRSDLAGVRDRLSILTESDVGRWLDPGHGGQGRIELREALRAGAVVYFSLQSDSRPLLAQMLGAAIVQDLQAAVSSLQGRPLPALVAIDEFSALAAGQVAGLFGRARSAGFSLLLATQELADLRLAGNERLLEQALGNLSLLIAHRQVLPASAELLAGLAGTREGWRVARRSDGSATRTLAEEPVLRAGRLAGLRPGCAAVLALSEGRSARLVRIRRGDAR